MSARSLDAIFYVRTVPEIAIEDGMFRVTYDIGERARFEVIMPPHVYIKALKQANIASDEFHERTTVVQFRKH